MRYHVRLPADPASAARARRVASTAMVKAGVGERPEVLLVVSELVTNAVVHARSDVELALDLHDRRLRVEVADRSREPPRLRCPEPLDPSGRGVLLVDHFSDSWGADMGPDGKVVWCEVAI